MIEYSIADAKNQLPRIVHEVEREGAVQLTRRGRPVAVLLSGTEYERLRCQGNSLLAAITAWRREAGAELADLSADEIGSWRDRSPGRDFEWPE